VERSSGSSVLADKKVLDQLTHSNFAFWLLALLIATVDSLVILKPGEFTYRILRGLRVKLRASPSPYLMQGREPIITLISYPATPFFLCSTETPSRSRAEMKLALFAAKRTARNCRQLSTLAVTTLILFIVVGPIFSVQLDTGRAIVFVWGACYFISVATIVYLLINQNRFGLTRHQILKISIELTFCPFLMVNIVKK
jgi:hypothetical protein